MIKRKKFKEDEEVCCVRCCMEIDGWGIPCTAADPYGEVRTGWAHQNKRKCQANIAEEKANQDFQDALQRW